MQKGLGFRVYGLGFVSEFPGPGAAPLCVAFYENEGTPNVQPLKP